MPTGMTAKLQGATAALVQVATSDASCFEAVLDNVKKNDGLQFQAQCSKDGCGGGGDGGPDSLCDENLCANDSTLAQRCEEVVDLCLAVEDINQDECVGAAWFQCQVL